MKKVVLLSAKFVGVAAVSLVAASAAYAGFHLYRSAELAKGSEPFQSMGRDGTPRVLVIGDSTAEGTGATLPGKSLAGLVASGTPGLTVVNRGKDGARFREFVDQIHQDDVFDVILVVGGGNDVIRFTSEDSLQAGVTKVATEARRHASLVVFIPPGNVGNAPFFLPPWRWLMTRRAMALHRIVSNGASASGSLYVNLYKDRAEDPFAQEPDRMNAPDGLHPSDEGYRLWYSELERQTRWSERLKASSEAKVANLPPKD